MRTKGDKFQPVHVVVRDGVYAYRLKGWKSGTYRSLAIAATGEKKAEEAAWAKAWEEFRKGDDLRTGSILLGPYASKFYGPECPHSPSVLADGKQIQDRTAKVLRAQIANHLLGLSIMSKRVCDITRADAERGKREIIKNLGVSRASESAFSVLITILRTAYNDEMIPTDPLLRVKRIKHRRQSRKAFSVDQVERFFCRENFDSDLAFAVFTFARLSGMRRAEILALEWSQIKEFSVESINPKTKESEVITRKKIIVDRAWKNSTNTILGLPKWEKQREFPVVAVLEEHLAWWKSKNPFTHSGLVFRASGDRTLSNKWWQANFDHAFAKAFPEIWEELKEIQKAGGKANKPIVPHSLRHTLATEMAANGVSDRAIQAGFGWSSADIQSGYTHLEAERMLESFDEGTRKIGGK